MKHLVLETPQATLRFHDLAGSDAPLVFVHGLGCASSCDYPAVAREPALASRRAILVDLLGSGFSDRPEDFEYTVAAHARVVVALLEALGVATCDLFGHSMGGAVAIVPDAGRSMAWENPAGLAQAIAAACRSGVPDADGPGQA